ncbi:MAG: hypothetical protein KDK65_07810, partial [Chlamydiia bacterium]|nr:hypothetical protein [Chlamydiia bacterium]
MNPLQLYYLPNPNWHKSVDCLVCYNVSVVIRTSEKTYAIDVDWLLQEVKSHVPKRDFIKERDEILKADQLSEYRILCQEICRLPYRFQREFFKTPIFGTTPSLFYIATARPDFLEC